MNADALAERLREGGFRVTEPRMAVIRVLVKAREHVNPEDILQRGRVLYPRLGRATVYRTLDLLTRVGAIRPIYLNSGTPRYTFAEGGHHHLVCSGCGAVIEFAHCAATRLGRRLAGELGFEISGHLLEFYGRCKTCRPSS